MGQSQASRVLSDFGTPRRKNFDLQCRDRAYSWSFGPAAMFQTSACSTGIRALLLTLMVLPFSWTQNDFGLARCGELCGGFGPTPCVPECHCVLYQYSSFGTCMARLANDTDPF
ncbi:uncharacterized protein LOC144130385 [Amblyomma americanum]